MAGKKIKIKDEEFDVSDFEFVVIHELREIKRIVGLIK